MSILGLKMQVRTLKIEKLDPLSVFFFLSKEEKGGNLASYIATRARLFKTNDIVS